MPPTDCIKMIIRPSTDIIGKSLGFPMFTTFSAENAVYIENPTFG